MRLATHPAGPPVRRWRPLAGLLLVALLAASCSDGRSVEAFCERLHEGERSVREVAAGAGGQDEPLLALAILLGGVGEYRGMVDDLAEVAPDEIRADMERARDSFQRQAEAASGAGSLADLAFGAVAGFVDGLSNRTAFEAVDQYASANCGMTVFSLTAVDGFAAGPDESQQAMSEDAPCPGLDFLAYEVTSSEVAATLTAAQELGVDGLTEVAAAAADLDPAASNLEETLGRIGWGAGGAAAISHEINEAVLATCSRPMIDASVQPLIEESRPLGSPDEGVYHLGAYDPDCADGGFAYSGSQDRLHAAYNGSHVVVWCRNAPIVLGLEDGTPFYLEGGDQLSRPDRVPVLTDNHVFWSIREEVPPTGLEAAGEDVVLLRQGLTPPYALDEVLREPSDSSSRLLDATGEHILIGIQDELQVLHEDGTDVLTVPGSWPSAEHLVDGVWATGAANAPLVDVRAGTTFTLPGMSDDEQARHRRDSSSNATIDRCDARVFVVDGRGSGWILARDGSSSLTAQASDVPSGRSVGALPENPVVKDPQDLLMQGPRVYDREGNQIWHPPDGAGRSALFGGVLYAMGQTGEIFEVDPFDDEVTPAQLEPDYRDALFFNETLHVDQVSGEVVLFMHSISNRPTDSVLRVRTVPCDQ